MCVCTCACTCVFVCGKKRTRYRESNTGYNVGIVHVSRLQITMTVRCCFFNDAMHFMERSNQVQAHMHIHKDKCWDSKSILIVS